MSAGGTIGDIKDAGHGEFKEPWEDGKKEANMRRP